MRTLTIMILLLGLLSNSLSAQYSVSFGNVSQWTFRITSDMTPESALQATNLLNSSPEVILARVNVNGDVCLFTTENPDAKAIKEKLAGVQGIRYTKIRPAVSSKSEYVRAYALALNPGTEEYNGAAFEVLPFADQVKQEKSFGLAKSLWIELYPDKYSVANPNAAPETPEEKAERLAKEQKVDFKSKNK